MPYPLANNDELLEFFRQEHAAYSSLESLTAWAQLSRRVRAKTLRLACLHYDPFRGMVYKTRIAQELPQVAKELTSTVTEAETEYESKIQKASDDVKAFCPPETLFFSLGQPPFPPQLHEDPLKHDARIRIFLERIDPKLANGWKSHYLHVAGAMCLKYSPTDNSSALGHVILEAKAKPSAQNYFQSQSNLPKNLVEYVPPLPAQFNRFITCHEIGHTKQPFYVPNRHNMPPEFGLYIEASAEKEGNGIFLRLGGSQRVTESFFHARSIWALLQPLGHEMSKTSWSLDNLSPWNDADGRNVLVAHRKLRKLTRANLDLGDKVRTWGSVVSRTMEDRVSVPLIRSARDLLYRGDFEADPILQRTAELAVEAALIHCPTTILDDLQVFRPDSNGSFNAAQARENLKTLLTPPVLAR